LVGSKRLARLETVKGDQASHDPISELVRERCRDMLSEALEPDPELLERIKAATRAYLAKEGMNG
jgi:hypothetical protein